MSISEYFEWYILNIPAKTYIWGLLVFLLVLMIMSLWKGFGQGFRYAVILLLAEYTALLMYFTVFIRRSTGVLNYILTPFWSYLAIKQGTRVLIQEVGMNIAVFIPIGIMAAIILQGTTWWKVVLTGVGISICVELMQLMLSRGVCEVDDVIHNTTGALIGYWIVKGKYHRLLNNMSSWGLRK